MILIRTPTEEIILHPPLEPFYQDWRAWSDSWVWDRILDMGGANCTIYNRDDYRGGNWEVVGGARD